VKERGTILKRIVCYSLVQASNRYATLSSEDTSCVLVTNRIASISSVTFFFIVLKWRDMIRVYGDFTHIPTDISSSRVGLNNIEENRYSHIPVEDEKQ